jgi:hypothetical protein
VVLDEPPQPLLRRAAVTSPAASWQMMLVTQASIFWVGLALASTYRPPGRAALRAFATCTPVIGQPSWAKSESALTTSVSSRSAAACICTGR